MKFTFSAALFSALFLVGGANSARANLEAPSSTSKLDSRVYLADQDRDKVPDRADACPQIAGMKSKAGCPNPEHAVKGILLDLRNDSGHIVVKTEDGNEVVVDNQLTENQINSLMLPCFGKAFEGTLQDWGYGEQLVGRLSCQ